MVPVSEKEGPSSGESAREALLGGASGQKTAGSGGFLGSEQVYLGFPELTPDQLDHLEIESPFSLQCKLS